MLMNIVNIWDEVLISGIIMYLIAILLVIATFLATKSKHTIIGAIFALISMTLCDVAKIAVKISILLALARVILGFI